MGGPLSDKELSELLGQQKAIETRLRSAQEGSKDINERSSAEAACRHATASRRGIEQWMASRMARAHGVATT